MLRSLRTRLMLSHVGLLFIVIPLLGIALVFVLESQVVLQNLARQLTGQAVLVAELLDREDEPPWETPDGAQRFVDHIAPLFPGQLQLLDGRGMILASSDSEDLPRVGQKTRAPGIEVALGGENFSRVVYSRDRQAEVADVLVPFRIEDGPILAVVRITDTLSTTQQRFVQLRKWTAVVLALGLALGALLGLLLAVTVERPLIELTRAVEAVPATGAANLPTQRGPEEVRLLARAFQAALDRVQRLEENRRYLLSNIVHELGRPLGALRAAGRALLDGAADEPDLRHDLLKGMDGEIARMEILLDELAGLRKASIQAAPLRLREVALSPWLTELAGPWREAALAAGLSWDASIPPDLPPARIDPERLGQALGNLLSNAVKYTPRGGAVSVTARAEEGAWIFRVDDSGPGIPDEARERIFEPFYRVPPERHFPQGLGLGLAIARDIVRAHGGDISLDTCTGAGACFTARLPLVSSP